MFTLELIHPKVVHFIIALLPASILLDLAGYLKRDSRYHFAGFLNLAMAAAAGLGAVIAGLIAEEGLEGTGGTLHQLLEIHENLGFVVLGITLALLIWRLLLKRRFPRRAGVLYLVIGIVGIGIMVTGAHLGGKMVFEYGAGSKAPVIQSGGNIQDDEIEETMKMKDIDSIGREN